jgi:PAS domain S-box-containing protein
VKALLFDSTVFDDPQSAIDFIENVLESSTEYSIIGTDLDGTIQLWNEGARRLHGYEPEENIGKTNFLILHVPEDVDAGRPKEIMDATLRDGKWEGTIQRIRKDGRRFTAGVVITPRRDPSGTPIGFLLISKDISEEIRLTEELAATQFYTRSLIESNIDALMATDPEGTITDVNQQMETLTGFTREELIGSPFKRYFTDPERAEEAIRAVLRDGRVTNYELTARSKNSRTTLVSYNASTFFDRDGKLQGVFAAARDITERKQAEARFQGLLEAAPDAIVVVDITGIIRVVNRQTESLFGYGRDELVGQPVEVLVPDRVKAVHPSHRSGYFADPRTRPMGAAVELTARCKDGTELPVDIALSPLETEEGTLVSAAIRDITERKRFERSLQEKNVEFERASRAKDRFLASMSHELRTPLNAVIGFTGALLMGLPGPLTGEQESQLKIIQTSARHLLSLINDLLDLAKIEAGKIELALEPVVCQTVVDEVAQTLRPLAEQKRLRFEVKAPEEGIVVRADRRALSQILLNLTNNAIKFTEQGTVSLEIGRRQDNGHNLAEIRVVDTGIGIRPEDQAKLFEAFEQVQPAESRQEGTGLGLHLSMKLAELLGARIGCESAPDKGTVFTVELSEA